MTHLLLTLALVAQAIGGGESQAGKPDGNPESGSRAYRRRVMSKSPRRKLVRDPACRKPQKELQEAVAKRRAAARKRALTYQQKTKVEAAVAKAMREWEAKVGPSLAVQQREQMRLRILAQQTQAMQQMAEAAQMNAAANNARSRLDSQALGQSQIFVPGQGMVPYPYSIIQPVVPFVPPKACPSRR